MNARSAFRARLATWLAPLVVSALAATSAAQQDFQPIEKAPPSAQAPPTVLSISVEGERRYREEDLIKGLDQPIGAPLDRTRIARGLESLFKTLRVVGKVSYRERPGGVELQLVVDEWPVDLEPRFVGNSEVKTEQLLKWAQLPERGELYLFQAERVRQRLLEGYRQDGYFFAEIDVVKRGDLDTQGRSEGEIPDVIFEIREGPQVRVKDLVVQGNAHLPDRGMWFWRDGLQKLSKVELEGPTLFNWYGSKFDQEKLSADLVAMRNTYRDLGYLDAVVEQLPLEFSADRSKVTIRVIVDEGVPYRISSLTIKGVKRERDPKNEEEFTETEVPLVFPEKELLALCKLRAGATYSRVQQARDQQELKKRYGREGYVSHYSLGDTSWQFLEPVAGNGLLFDTDHHTVAVTYRIAQGEQRSVQEVLFEGARSTRDRVVRREIDVMPGDKIDVEEVTRSLGRLYSTAFFNDEYAPLDHKDPTYRYEPVEGQPDLLRLIYEVEEGRVVDLQLQGGLDSNNGAFGRIRLQMRNFDISNPPSSLWRLPGEIYEKEAFHGAGQLLVLDLSPGTLVNSYQLRFLEPDIFRTHFDRTSFDVDLNRRLRRYRFYDEERNEIKMRFGHEFGRDWSAFAGISHQQLDVTDIEAPISGFIDPSGFPLADTLLLEEGHSNLIGGLFDVAYSKLDRALNPNDGFRATWKNGFYGSPLGGDWDFVRSSVDADWFWPFGGDDEDVRPVLHLSLGVGVADEHSGTVDVPYTERFFLGGNRTLRGFAYRGVGPNKGGEPLGGETMWNGSLEYRQPLYSVAQPGTYRQVEVFHLKLFTDAGILDPRPWRLDPDELRMTVGFGFGMSSPLPISLNFGFPVKSGSGDREEVFSFSIVNITF